MKLVLRMILIMIKLTKIVPEAGDNCRPTFFIESFKTCVVTVFGYLISEP